MNIWVFGFVWLTWNGYWWHLRWKFIWDERWCLPGRDNVTAGAGSPAIGFSILDDAVATWWLLTGLQAHSASRNDGVPRARKKGRVWRSSVNRWLGPRASRQPAERTRVVEPTSASARRARLSVSAPDASSALVSRSLAPLRPSNRLQGKRLPTVTERGRDARRGVERGE